MHEFGDIQQLGYVVADLDASVRAWSTQLEIGPWSIFRNVTLTCEYRGSPSAPLIDVALAFRGAMQIELIQQKDESDSPYRRMIEQQSYGLHHFAFLSEAIHDDIETARGTGLQTVCDIRMPDGSRYAYLQSEALGNEVYIEIMEATPAMKAMFQTGPTTAAEWDGDTLPTEFDMQAG